MPPVYVLGRGVGGSISQFHLGKKYEKRRRRKKGKMGKKKEERGKKRGKIGDNEQKNAKKEQKLKQK